MHMFVHGFVDAAVWARTVLPLKPFVALARLRMMPAFRSPKRARVATQASEGATGSARSAGERYQVVLSPLNSPSPGPPRTEGTTAAASSSTSQPCARSPLTPIAMRAPCTPQPTSPATPPLAEARASMTSPMMPRFLRDPPIGPVVRVGPDVRVGAVVRVAHAAPLTPPGPPPSCAPRTPTGPPPPTPKAAEKHAPHTPPGPPPQDMLSAHLHSSYTPPGSPPEFAEPAAGSAHHTSASSSG